MRILTVTNLFPSEARPGHGLFVKRRMQAIADAGHQVTALVPVPARQKAAAGWDATTRGSIRVCYAPFRTTPGIGMYTAPAAMRKSLLNTHARFLSDTKFDLVDAHYFYPDAVAAAALAQALGLPLVVSARGTDINLLPRYRIPRAKILQTASYASAVIAVSQALGTALVSLGVEASKVHVIPNGVDLEFFCPRRDQPRPRQTRLLYVGNLVALKRVDIAIRALVQLEDAVLDIAGVGPLESKLQKLVQQLGLQNRVRFLGHQQPETLRGLYRGSSALVLMSSREGLPNVILEALACGLPVVAAAVGGIPEVLEGCRAARVLDEVSPSALASAVMDLAVACPHPAIARCQVDGYSWQTAASRQCELYADVTGLPE